MDSEVVCSNRWTCFFTAIMVDRRETSDTPRRLGMTMQNIKHNRTVQI